MKGQGGISGIAVLYLNKISSAWSWTLCWLNVHDKLFIKNSLWPEFFIMSNGRLTLFFFFFTDLDPSLRTCYSHKNGGVLPLSENSKQPFQQKLKVLYNLADQF